MTSVCTRCGLDLGVDRAHEVRRLSFEAAGLLRRRDALIAEMRAAHALQRVTAPAERELPPAPTSLPAAPKVGAGEAGRSAPARRRTPSTPVRVAAPPRSPAKRLRPRRDISMQPILAGAGAALLAVAAIVFVFFTFGDNLALRAVVTGIVTVTAATVAALLRRGGLRTTSEAVAALAAVLCWVDVELAMQAGFLGGLDPAMARAVVLAGLAPAFVAVGYRLRVRTWASAGLVAALAVPLSAAAGLPGPARSAWSAWWWVAAFVLVAFVAWAAMRLVPTIATRLGTSLGVERGMLRAVRAAALPAALAASLMATEILSLTRMGAITALWSAVVAVAVAGGYLLRIRSWMSVAALAAPATPALAVAGVPGAAWTTSAPWSAWWWTLGCVLVAFVALAAMRAVPAFGRRLGDDPVTPFDAESQFLRVVRAAGIPAALVVSVAAPATPPLSHAGTTAILWSAVVAAALLGGYLLRVRSWVTAAVLASLAVPALVAAALPVSAWSAWSWTSAGVVTAFTALVALRGLPRAARRLGDGLGRPFTAEAGVLRVVRGAGFPLALLASCLATAIPPLNGWGTTTVLWSAVVAVALGAGWALRVRSWMSVALLAVLPLPLLGEPAFLGGMPGVAWRWTGEFLLVAVLAWVGGRVVGPIARRLGVTDPAATFRAELFFLRLVRGAGIPLALAAATALPLVAAFGSPPDTALSGRFPLTSAALWLAVILFGAVAGHWLRVRAWLSAALLTAPLLPFWAVGVLDAEFGVSWPISLAYLAAALLTLLPRAADVVSGLRLAARFAPERTVLDVGAGVAVVIAVIRSIGVQQPDLLPGTGGTAVLVALAAVTAALLRRFTHHRIWLFAGGALAVAAGALLGWGPGDPSVGWAPLGAACAWTALAVLTAPRLIRSARLGSVHGALASRTRDDLLLSGWVVVAAAAVPAAILVLGRAMDLWAAALSAPRADWLLPASAPVGPMFGAGVASALPAWAGLGTVALAAITLLATRLAPGDHPARLERLAAPYLALLAMVGLTLHPGLPAVATLVLLGLLGLALVAATAARQAAWPRLVPVVDAVQNAGRVLARAAEGLRVIGGRPVAAVERRHVRHAALAGSVAVIALLGAYSWLSRPTAVAGALAVSALVLALRGTYPRPAHPWLVGVAYVYPLVVLGVVLAWLDLSLVAAVCTVSAVASLVTIAVTLGSRTSRNEWYVVLGVTALPFLAGVVTVVFERTWWSAGAAAAMLALELVLLLTARAGLPVLVRAGSAFLLLPTASVMITSAGAMILEVSGSPYVLPTAATFVSAVAAGAARVAERIDARVPDGGPDLARVIRGMLERSALLTGSITILLAYARPAAGPDIAVAVLLVLAAGAALVARERGRRRVWLLAGALLLAALWTALSSRGVRLVEAYTFPPAAGAVLVGVLIAWRLGRSRTTDGDDDGLRGRADRPGTRDADGPTAPPRPARNAWALAGAGVALAVVPTFIVYLTRADAGDWRAWALAAVALAALGSTLLAGRLTWARPARLGLTGAAAFAALAGVIESWRVAPMPGAWPGDRGVRSRVADVGGASSSTVDRIGEPFVGIPAATDPAFVVGLVWAAVAVAVLVLSVLAARPAAGPRLTGLLRGYGFVPALVLGTASVLAHMEPAWGAVITLLVVELGLLTLLVLGVRRLVAGGAVGAPPWLVWVCAALVAIAAWAPRELRVETFSAPLGVALILAGWVALRDGIRRDRAGATAGSATAGATAAGTTAAGAPGGTPPRIGTWPVGFAGSWRTLALGILALVGPSVLSTATDPLTVRASGVVFVALMAVLAGSRLRLSAPFWLGVVTLGVEVLVVFAKLGVGVSPLPWILTLVPAAIVLLIIATLDERRTAASGGTAAYLRDLR